jgi:hypothetical protein
MKYDERDDEIYPKWAVWCAKSDDKYYIDGKDGHFFTHVRTEEEIADEQAKRRLFDLVMNERFVFDETNPTETERRLFSFYEEAMNLHPDAKATEIVFIPFEEWKKNQPDVE